MKSSHDFSEVPKKPGHGPYDHTRGFQKSHGHFLEGAAAAGEVYQVGCHLAQTYKLVRKMCPFYLACENEFRGKHWECNHGRTDPEYIAYMAAKDLLRPPMVPEGPGQLLEKVAAFNRQGPAPPMVPEGPAEGPAYVHAAEGGIGPDEAGAARGGRPMLSHGPAVHGQLYDETHHRRGDGQLSGMNGRRERALQFVLDIPAYVGFSQGLRAFRGAGMGGTTTFKRLWKLRKAFPGKRRSPR